MATMSYTRQFSLNANDLERIIRKQHNIPDAMGVEINFDAKAEGEIVVNVEVSQTIETPDDKNVDQQVSAFFSSMNKKG